MVKALNLLSEGFKDNEKDSLVSSNGTSAVVILPEEPSAGEASQGCSKVIRLITIWIVAVRFGLLKPEARVGRST